MTNRGCKSTVSLFAVAVTILFMFVSPVLADNHNMAERKILILNSNGKVTRYASIEKEIKVNITAFPYQVINLRGKPADKTALLDIRNYDPDVIICIGSKALLLVNRQFPEKKRVFSSVVNWRRFPMDKNTFGVSNDLHIGMQVTMFRYLFPELQKIGVLYSKRTNQEWVDVAIREARQQAGLEVVGYPIENPGQLNKALAASLTQVQAIWLIADPIVLSSRKSMAMIFTASHAAKKPVFTYNELFSRLGATFVLAADATTMAWQTATLAESLVTGKEIPVDEPVQMPGGSYLLLNKKKVVTYKVKVNNDALSSINKLIE